ncbi:MAG TPA: cache domain-containing protein [Nitrososphaeraceae archaeon]|nr:cache domain-containing protein [Nitrososphaeraceae archaeon]
MQIIKRNQKKNGFATATIRNLSILVLSVVMVLTPSLSFQSQTNNGTKYSSGNGANYNNNPNNSLPIAVFPAESKPYGLTYGEWTAKWWQWGYSIPKNINPAYDDTGKYCTQKQNGPVWFLAGTYGHPVNRKCDIPAGKAILFPILNSECSFAEFPKLKTLSELRICAKTIQNQVTTLNAAVDGVAIPNLQKYRILSPSFNFTLPQNNILGLPANVTTQAIADGNWVFLKPLPPGSHRITFRGGVLQQQEERTNIVAGESSTKASTSSSNNNNNSFSFPTGWDFQTTYDLTVENNNETTAYGHYTSDLSSSNPNSTIKKQNNNMLTTTTITTTTTAIAQRNVVKLLSDMIRNRLHDAVNLLEITSKDPIIQNVSFANYITKKYMGIPANVDMQKRRIAQDILARDKDIRNIYFLTPNADIYFGEPFSYQQQLPKLNYADRDWYKGVTTTNSTYISAVFMSASIHAPAIAIATPVYALQDNNTITGKTTNKVISGYWVGILDLQSVQESIKNLNLTNDERIVLVDYNGTVIVNHSPSAANNNNISSTKLQDFRCLDSVKAVRNGSAGSIFETVNGTKILSIYQPIQLGNRFWGVILMKSVI